MLRHQSTIHVLYCQSLHCIVTDCLLNAVGGVYNSSLRRLELFGCPSLGTECLNTVAQNCPNLKDLNIGKIPKISNSCLTNMMSDLKRLGSLDLTGLHSVSFEVHSPHTFHTGRAPVTSLMCVITHDLFVISVNVLKEPHQGALGNSVLTGQA